MEFLTDDDREDMIEVKSIEFQCERSIERRRELWAELRLLINGRSAQQIRRMEIAKGLHA